MGLIFLTNKNTRLAREKKVLLPDWQKPGAQTLSSDVIFSNFLVLQCDHSYETYLRLVQKISCGDVYYAVTTQSGSSFGVNPMDELLV